MALQAYTVFGTDENPKIQFYHEIVNPKNTKSDVPFPQLHTQDYYEFNFFIAGKRNIKVGDRVYSFKAGEIFLAAPEEVHGGEMTHGVLDRYRLHIFPRALESLPQGGAGLHSLFRRERRQPHRSQRASAERDGVNRIVLSEHQQQAVYHYLSNIDNSIKLGNPQTRDISAYADILKLLVLLCDLLDKKEASLSPKNKLLLDILSFIETSYDSVSVGEIEQHFCLSHATLWRLFSRELHASPSAYILDIRLKKARIMLSQDFDIQTVAEQCGFCDCSYFIKKFKKKYGETPHRFRAEKEHTV